MSSVIDPSSFSCLFFWFSSIALFLPILFILSNSLTLVCFFSHLLFYEYFLLLPPAVPRHLFSSVPRLPSHTYLHSPHTPTPLTPIPSPTHLTPSSHPLYSTLSPPIHPPTHSTPPSHPLSILPPTPPSPIHFHPLNDSTHPSPHTHTPLVPPTRPLPSPPPGVRPARADSLIAVRVSAIMRSNCTKGTGASDRSRERAREKQMRYRREGDACKKQRFLQRGFGLHYMTVIN